MAIFPRSRAISVLALESSNLAQLTLGSMSRVGPIRKLIRENYQNKRNSIKDVEIYNFILSSKGVQVKACQMRTFLEMCLSPNIYWSCQKLIISEKARQQRVVIKKAIRALNLLKGGDTLLSTTSILIILREIIF